MLSEGATPTGRENNDRERLVDTGLFITVSGPPGCGATTICERLSTALNCGYVNGGELFRRIAEERDMSLRQLIAKAQETDEIDRALDRRLRRIAEEWGTANKPFVLESRLAGWIAGNRADLRVWLDAPEEVRLERTADREELGAEMRVREVAEASRYENYYGIDLEDRSFYDIAINTARWDPDAVVDALLTAVDGYDPATDEGAFRTKEIDV